MKKLTMKEVQQGSLNILKVIDRICRQNDLQYCLAYGTLLGAVRHKGFIPWDDDVDIMMPRKDYDLLVDYFVRNKEALEPYVLLNKQYNPNYPYMISRVSDNRYILDVDNEVSYGIGLFVDIYPLDGAGNTIEEYTKRKRESSRYAALCFLTSRIGVKRENTVSFCKYMLKYPAFLFAKILGRNFFMKRLENIQRRCDYSNSKYIGCMVWGSDEGLKGIFPKEWFSEMVDAEFEGDVFKIPKEYDKVLSRCYGKYMDLPPENKRIAHHFYDAYLKE